MASFLTTHGTSYHIEKLITRSVKKLILVSPYLQLSKTFVERICDAGNRGVKIYIVYGKEELRSNEKQVISQLPNLSLFFFENLHAKCYLNESEMVITSMNMYEFSEKNNREMGVLISRKDDAEVYKDAVAEIQSIIEASQSVELFKDKEDRKKKYLKEERSSYGKKKNNTGFCIRCETDIPFNPEKPLCYSCYEIWASFDNPDYQEKVCHDCGKSEPTSMYYPLCMDCFKKNANRSSFSASNGW